VVCAVIDALRFDDTRMKHQRHKTFTVATPERNALPGDCIE
jgi:hypothetical protein